MSYVDKVCSVDLGEQIGEGSRGKAKRKHRVSKSFEADVDLSSTTAKDLSRHLMSDMVQQEQNSPMLYFTPVSQRMMIDTQFILRP